MEMITNIKKYVNEHYILQKEYLGADKPVNRFDPLLSIIVTTYQHSKYIKTCLDGILEQKADFTLEVILGEDGSVDGTREICIEYAQRFPDKIRLFLRDRDTYQPLDSRGVPITRLNGSWSRKAARGKYIAWCEGDDFWVDPLKIQKQVDFLEANPQYALCFHKAKVINNAGEVTGFAPDFERSRDFSIEELLRNNVIQTGSVVYRNVIKDWPEGFYHLPMGDWPSNLLIAKTGEMFFMNEVMSVYRRHENGVWTSKPESQRSMARENFYRFAIKHLTGAEKESAISYRIKNHERMVNELLRERKIGKAFREKIFKNPVKSERWKNLISFTRKCLKHYYRHSQ